MKLKCKKTTQIYPFTIGKVYESQEESHGFYKIRTDIGSTIWVKLGCKDYEFEILKKYKKEYD